MSGIAPISTEARGKVRRFKAEIATTSAQTERVMSKRGLLDDAVIALTKKNSPKGRARAADKLRRLLPHVRWMPAPHRKCILGAYLAPIEPMITTPEHAGQLQNAVSVRYLLIGLQSENHIDPICSRGHWTLEVPDHALGRMFERDPTLNMTNTLFAAHQVLLDAEGIELPLPGSTFYTAAGSGVFICEFIVGEDKTAPVYHDNNLAYARARTWLHRDQLHDDQVPLLPGSPTLGESVFLPMPLRELVIGREGIRVLLF